MSDKKHVLHRKIWVIYREIDWDRPLKELSTINTCKMRCMASWPSRGAPWLETIYSHKLHKWTSTNWKPDNHCNLLVKHPLQSAFMAYAAFNRLTRELAPRMRVCQFNIEGRTSTENNDELWDWCSGHSRDTCCGYASDVRRGKLQGFDLHGTIHMSSHAWHYHLCQIHYWKCPPMLYLMCTLYHMINK